MRLYSMLLVGLTVIVPAQAALAAAAPTRSAAGLLIGASGLTLYTYDSDTTPGKSACTGPCAALWPPYAADAAASVSDDYSVISRADGSYQWAFKAKPLYLYAADKNAGDTVGDGVNDVWHIVH